MKYAQYVQIAALSLIILGSISFISNHLLNPEKQVASVIGSGSGLIANYTFDDGTATDSAGSHSGSVSGATSVSGKIGQALLFDGVNDSVSLGPDFIGTGDVTVTAWIKPNSLGQNNLGAILNNNSFFIEVSNGNVIYVRNANNNVTISESGSITLGQWQHIAVTRSGKTIAIYINGVSKCGYNCTSPDDPVAGTTGLYIGNRNANDRAFDGIIDEVRVYNRVLAPDEIQAVYGGSVDPVPPPPTPTAINGACSTTVNMCTAGTLSDIPDTSTQNLWQCVGSNGGTTASCSSQITQTPPTTKTHPAGAGPLIPADRQIDWTQAGIPGGIPSYTTICANVKNAPFNAKGDGVTDDAAAIQAAIDSCVAGSNKVVYLPTGTYATSKRINFNKSGLVLRGDGPGKTIINLKVADTTALGFGNSQSYNDINLYPITRDITSGYTKGSKTLQVTDASQYHVGDMLLIDQLNDNDLVTTHTGYDCTYCGREKGQRSMGQIVEITAISGNTISINIPMYWTYKSILKPQVTAILSSHVVRRSGIEDMTIMQDTPKAYYLVTVESVQYSWMRNVEIKNVDKRALWLLETVQSEFRDNYLHNGITTFGHDYGYGMMIDSFSTANLIENNLFTSLSSMIQGDVGMTGNVIGYNYMYDMKYDDPTWLLYGTPNINHAAHPFMSLWEGNVGYSASMDEKSGSSSHHTIFRNYFKGWQSPTVLYNNAAIYVHARNRYMNILGNVLGTPGKATVYEQAYPDTPTPNFSQNSIYHFGYGDDAFPTPGDPQSRDTTIRWGNYDYVTNATRWDPNEIPSDVQVPGTQTLPASLYLSGKPVWFGSLTFPPIGPDVAGLVNKIPAQYCYEQGKMPNCLYVTQTTPPTTYAQGDFNKDGVVNSIDLSMMAGAWNTSNATYDLNKDGSVNTLDYTIMVRNWTT